MLSLDLHLLLGMFARLLQSLLDLSMQRELVAQHLDIMHPCSNLLALCHSHVKAVVPLYTLVPTLLLRGPSPATAPQVTRPFPSKTYFLFTIFPPCLPHTSTLQPL